MTYAPKHAKPTSLMVAVLGVRGEQPDTRENHGDADGAADHAALTVPKPRAAAQEADQPAAS